MATILLVEDNAEMQMLLSDLLGWGGHQVITGRTGQEGLELLAAASNTPDVIISDLTMPMMDGMDFLRHVRGNPAWSHVPFILMSANPHDERLISLPQEGANGLLSKPFSLKDLNEILGAG